MPAESFDRPPDAVITVSSLNRLARELIESNLPLLWVAGEVSNLTLAASGHAYFSLKDAGAQVRCVMFRSRLQLLAFRLADGMRIELRALATIYEPRGDFQLNAETARRAGIGALFEALERLKARLSREGLFDAGAKRPLPRYPRCIGVVTSPHAAALRDVITILRRRCPHVPIVLYPTPVQGDDAPAAMVRALENAGRHGRCEVLILARGGGSIEDLWAFNDEGVARAIRASSIPVVCGVGHETDTTIADFAADVRAATPSAAAELASAGFDQARPQLDALAAQLRRGVARILERAMQRADLLSSRLSDPAHRVGQMRTLAQQTGARLRTAFQRECELRRHALDAARLRLAASRPRPASERVVVEALAARLDHAWDRRQQRVGARLDSLAALLAHLDPASALRRGFAIARDPAGGVIRDSRRLAPGDALHLQFGQGWARVRVTETG